MSFNFKCDIEGVPYSECLIPTRPEHLLEVKSKYIYNLDEAKEIAKNIVEIVKDVKQEYMNDNELVIDNEVNDIMNNLLLESIKFALREELK